MLSEVKSWCDFNGQDDTDTKINSSVGETNKIFKKIFLFAMSQIKFSNTNISVCNVTKKQKFVLSIIAKLFSNRET